MFRLHWDKSSFFFLFGGTKFTHAQYINLMYEFNLTWQKFDFWIGVTFLSDSATRPVECVAEMHELIQFRCWISVEFNSLNWIWCSRNVTCEWAWGAVGICTVYVSSTVFLLYQVAFCFTLCPRGRGVLTVYLTGVLTDLHNADPKNYMSLKF